MAAVEPDQEYFLPANVANPPIVKRGRKPGPIGRNPVLVLGLNREGQRPVNIAPQVALAAGVDPQLRPGAVTGRQVSKWLSAHKKSGAPFLRVNAPENDPRVDLGDNEKTPCKWPPCFINST